MNVLLTGGSGFLGRKLAARLAGDGHRVIGVSKESVDLGAGAESLQRDLVDGKGVAELAATQAVDVIIHLAGLANVGASWKYPAEYFRVNVLATDNLLHAFPGTKLVLASSAEVYGEVPERDQPLTENQPLAPSSPYALTKAAAERLVLNCDGTVMRLFTVVGPGQSRRFALPSFAEQLAELRCSGGGRMKVGNLEARRDFLHVDDAVEAIKLLALKETSESIYNIGGGETASIREVLDRLIALAGVDARVEVDPERLRPVDIPLLVADSRRIRALGWAPRRSLDDALQELWEESLGAVSASS